MIYLITGGASGLGEAITRRIAHESAHTVYFTFNKSAINAQKIEASFSNAIAIKCNFENDNEVIALKEKIGQLDLDVLINNAYSGSFIQSYFHKTPSLNFLIEFKYNLLPTITITQAAIDSFRKKKKGNIITILTSALSSVPPIGASVYVANKAYLEALTKVWGTENAKFNITSNTVSPSFMLTNFTKSVDERVVEQMRENHPQKKLLTTEEVADVVFSLSTKKINAENIIL